MTITACGKVIVTRALSSLVSAHATEAILDALHSSWFDDATALHAFHILAA